MSKEQRAMIDAMLRQPRPEGPQSVEAMRAGFRAMMATMIVPDGIRTTATTLGDRPALLVEPADARAPGRSCTSTAAAFVFGSPETALSLTGNLVARTGVRASRWTTGSPPSTRSRPRSRTRSSAYRALLDSGEDPAAIAFAGDSAGGGLAITTCLAARDAGLPLPAAIVGVLARASTPPGRARAWTPRQASTRSSPARSLEHTGAMYLAGQDPDQPMLSPAILADLTGFPPMLLQVGTNEVLLDDSTRMAARARAAGVDVILDITADVPHVFQSFAGVLDEADEALDRAALFLTQHIRTPDVASMAAG